MRRALGLFLFVVFITVWVPHPAFATKGADSWAEWDEAKSHFDSGRWSEALAGLLAHARPNDSSYYYNLGTTYYQLGNTGLAVANLEKANRIRPHHSDIQANLSLARQSLSQKIGSERLDPASSWVEQLADQVSFDEVRATLGFFTLALIMIWIRNYARTQQIKTVFFHPAAYLGTLALSITLAVYGIRLWANSHPCAILLEKQTIRSGPGDHFQLLEEAELGSKLRILGPLSSQEGADENWNQVRYSSEGIGWVKSKSLLIL